MGGRMHDRRLQESPLLAARWRFSDTPAMPRRFSLFVIALCITAFTSLAQEPAITPKHSRHYARYEGCEFVPTKYADGDSFKVRIGADEFVLRLYFVDAPESDERFADLNAEQAKYFGITPAESVEGGKAAKEF